MCAKYPLTAQQIQQHTRPDPAPASLSTPNPEDQALLLQAESEKGKIQRNKSSEEKSSETKAPIQSGENVEQEARVGPSTRLRPRRARNNQPAYDVTDEGAEETMEVDSDATVPPGYYNQEESDEEYKADNMEGSSSDDMEDDSSISTE